MTKIFLILISIYSLSLYSQGNNSLNNLKIGDTIPNFTDYQLKNLEGKIVDYQYFKGKPTFINLWFIGCKPCIEEIPELNKLEEKYRDRVNFISMTFESQKKVDSFIEKQSYNFSHIPNAGKYIKIALGCKSYPKNIVLDKNGKLISVKAGIPIITKIENGKKTKLNVDYTYFEKDLLKAFD